MPNLSDDVLKFKKSMPNSFTLIELKEIQKSFAQDIKNNKGDKDTLRMLHVLKANIDCNIEVKEKELKKESWEKNKIKFFVSFVFITLCLLIKIIM